MRERIDLSGYWQGRLVLNPALDVRAPTAIEQQFYVPLSWNLQIEHVRWPAPDQELSGVVRPLQNQNFRDIARKFSEGTIVYARTVELDAESCARRRKEGQRAVLVFEGSNYRTAVRWNGRELGAHEGGHLGFEFDVTEALVPGANALEVTVDNLRSKDACPQEQFNWQNYGGIYRPVYLEFRSAVHLGEVKVCPGRDAQGWYVEVAAALNRPAAAEVRAVLDSGGAQAEVSLAGRGERDYQARIRVADPVVWRVGVGGLSSLRLSVARGDELWDEREICFGFRTVELRGVHVYLNGEKIRFLGAAWHEQHPAFGNAVPEWQVERDLRLMRQVGLNAVRASHYPHAPGFYRACDRLGILVLAEMPCWQFNAYHYGREKMCSFCCDYARQMVAQLGHHPAIVGWLVQTESDTDVPGAREFFGAIAQTFKAHDPTRLTFSAESSKPPEHLQGLKRADELADDPPQQPDTLAAEVDVVGLNIYAGWYADKAEFLPAMLDHVHARLPGKALLVSEFGAEGIPGKRSLTMEPWTEDYQAELLCRHIRAILPRDYLAGFFIWLFMDYECSSIGILGINAKGLVSPERKPKLAFNAVQALLAEHGGNRREANE